MPLTVGTDSYLSQADATTYVGANYSSTSTEYVAWTALSTGDKDLYLRKACKKIDRQILRGIKALATQTLEFPRAIRTDYYNSDFPSTQIRYTADWVVETAVSQSVKDAQVEEAITMMSQGATASKRAALQAQGVKSFSLGSLSENYGTGLKSGVTRLLSPESQELMKYYIAGAVNIV